MKIIISSKKPSDFTKGVFIYHVAVVGETKGMDSVKCMAFLKSSTDKAVGETVEIENFKIESRVSISNPDRTYKVLIPE